MCPHVETDTRGSSKTLVRHTCKACLKVILELPRNEATVRESTAKDVSRADTSQFRDITRAMHVRPQMTLNAREVDLVLGLLTRKRTCSFVTILIDLWYGFRQFARRCD